MQEQGLKCTSTRRIRDSVLVWYSSAVCANEMGTVKAFFTSPRLQDVSRNDVAFDVCAYGAFSARIRAGTQLSRKLAKCWESLGFTRNMTRQ